MDRDNSLVTRSAPDALHGGTNNLYYVTRMDRLPAMAQQQAAAPVLVAEGSGSGGTPPPPCVYLPCTITYGGQTLHPSGGVGPDVLATVSLIVSIGAIAIASVALGRTSITRRDDTKH
jgi:hypothetical protein